MNILLFKKYSSRFFYYVRVFKNTPVSKIRVWRPNRKNNCSSYILLPLKDFICSTFPVRTFETVYNNSSNLLSKKDIYVLESVQFFNHTKLCLNKLSLNFLNVSQLMIYFDNWSNSGNP